MAIAFDGASKRIILDSASTSAAQIWSRWADWHEANPQWPLAMRQSGGDPVGGGIYSPLYYFLLNGWRVRPMESDHDLVITGNLVVEGGGTPVVRTLGPYQVNTAYVVPERAQGISTSGTPAPTASDVAAAVWSHANAVTLQDRVLICAKILRNKTITDPVTGVMTVYDDDGTTVLFTAQMYEGAVVGQTYRGQGAERRERLA